MCFLLDIIVLRENIIFPLYIVYHFTCVEWLITEIQKTNVDMNLTSERVRACVFDIDGAIFATKCAEIIETRIYNFITIMTEETIYIPNY